MPDSFQYQTYGAKVAAEGVRDLLDHVFNDMKMGQSPGMRPTPVCIWGLHGIGKTELVREMARERGFGFSYIAPAQFEEMGDLLGMPMIDQTEDDQTTVTRFAPPDWAPRSEGPGILLIDDVNRADDRILRGIMQLLQFYELVSWQLPDQWLIVLTANPDGGDYSVTPLDEAMLNRMLHVTMEFDVKAWAKWAEKHRIDARGINFVLAYPELVNGHRTTPRSLVQFFNSIASIDDLEANLGLVKVLGEACLDETTTQAFVNFIHLKLDRLPSPEMILDAEDFDKIKNRLERLVNDGATKRLDILSVLISRINNYVQLHPPGPAQLKNLQAFILLDLLPNDLRLAMAQELTASGTESMQQLYAMPEISRILLEKM
jgi:hypothetical protein